MGVSGTFRVPAKSCKAGFQSPTGIKYALWTALLPLSLCDINSSNVRRSLCSACSGAGGILGSVVHPIRHIIIDTSSVLKIFEKLFMDYLPMCNIYEKFKIYNLKGSIFLYL
jgi:hypothetical protein